jgi:hypothetical protein
MYSKFFTGAHALTSGALIVDVFSKVPKLSLASILGLYNWGGHPGILAKKLGPDGFYGS